MFWTVTEIQKLSNGTVASQTFDRTSYDEALSVYYSSLSAGAINGIPYHATYLIDCKRGVIMSNIYNRMEQTQT